MRFRRYFEVQKCITSKAAIAVLLWNFGVSFIYIIILRKSTTFAVSALPVSSHMLISITISGYAAILQLFHPIGGYLADTKLGRYKTIRFSLWILLLSMLSIGIAASLLYFPERSIVHYTTVGSICFAWLAFMVGFPGFNANVIQFGLDQLYHTPAEEQSLFIHWYKWTYSFSSVIINLVLDVNAFTHSKLKPFTLFAIPSLVIIVMLVISLLWFHRNRRWFNTCARKYNPYMLVYKVTKFSRQHKIPVNRSAFTYCEDQIPSGLELGKEKYGGPFTTEQVENVKTFYGILTIIFSLIPLLFVHTAERHILYLFPSYLRIHQGYSDDATASYNANFTELLKDKLLRNGSIYSIVQFFGIPFFVYLIRPLVINRIPGMLWRIGMGIIASILALTTIVIIDTVVQYEGKDKGYRCIFEATNKSLPDKQSESPVQYLLILQQILSAASHALFYIAVYEFICSQSPHSMKGFLLGIFYATRGLCEIFGSLMILPFALGLYQMAFPSCGMTYYTVNVLTGVVALVVFACTARKYKFRVRDDICPVRRHVEDIYSRLQDDISQDYGSFSDDRWLT